MNFPSFQEHNLDQSVFPPLFKEFFNLNYILILTEPRFSDFPENMFHFFL